MIAPGATEVQLVEQKPDAISINGWKSVQFVYTYEFFGLSYRRAITFLNFSASEQLVWDLTARAVNFENVYGRGYRVLNSLFERSADGAAGSS